MADKTAIEWTEATLNPWTGCTKVSPGCANCYIVRTPPFRVAGRAFVRGHVPLVFHMERLERVVARRKPTLYFVNSLSDLFHEDAPSTAIDAVFDAMRRAPQHTFQVLTKRPERMRDYLLERAEPGSCVYAPWLPLLNVWLGVSVENRRFVGRADVLRATPAAVRFVSAEPLLGPLVRPGDGVGCSCGWPLDTCSPALADGPCDRRAQEGPHLDLAGIDWLIVGGESGPRHRPMKLEWVRDLRDACLAGGTWGPDEDPQRKMCLAPHGRPAFFFKQRGGRTPTAGGRELDGRTWDEMPERVAA